MRAEAVSPVRRTMRFFVFVRRRSLPDADGIPEATGWLGVSENCLAKDWVATSSIASAEAFGDLYFM